MTKPRARPISIALTLILALGIVFPVGGKAAAYGAEGPAALTAHAQEGLVSLGETESGQEPCEDAYEGLPGVDEGPLGGKEDNPGGDSCEPGQAESEESTNAPDSQTQTSAGAPQKTAPLADEYIEIGTMEALAAIGQGDECPLNGKYRLTGNIALNGDWEPIGADTGAFTGEFEGGGFTISGLSVETDDNAGFFSELGAGASVKNLTLSVDTVSGGASAGALAGKSEGALLIKDCYVMPGGAASSIEGAYQTGGLLGAATGATVIENCGSSVDVTASYGWAGGLVGQVAGRSAAARASISKCYASGAVAQTGASSSARGAGGLAGFARLAEIENSYAAGDVESRAWSSGGLIGNVEQTSIEKCLASGNVRAFSTGSGGITWSAGPTSSIRDSAAANKYLAVFDLVSRSNRITTSTPASSLGGNIYYVYMACTPFGDATAGGDGRSMGQMRSKSSYANLGWDMGAVWSWDETNSCPKLRVAGHQPKDTLGFSEASPAIQAQPPAFSYMYVSEKLDLSLSVTGASLEYRWYRDGALLSDGEQDGGGEGNEYVSGSGTANLVIDNLQLMPSASYVAIVTNAHGETVSSRCFVSVRQGASAPEVANPESQTVAEGQRAEFSVTAANKEGEVLSYRWERSYDGGLGWESIPRSYGNAYTTTVLSKSSDGALFRCRVTNTLGPTSKTVTTEPASLTVLKAIQSVEISETYIVMEVGEKRQLFATCLPEDSEQDKTVHWDIGFGSTAIYIDIDTGEIEARREGTASVVAVSYANSEILGVCFIAVSSGSGGAGPKTNDGTPRLPVKTIKVNSLSSEGAAVQALPCDGCPFDEVSIAGISPLPKNGAFAITKAGPYIWNVSATGVPKGKYKLILAAENGGAQIGSSVSLTVNVENKMPAAKVRLPALNSFYQDSSGTIRITGAGLPKIESVTLSKSSKATGGDVTKNFGVYEDGGTYILYCLEEFGSLIKGKPASKGEVWIWYSGYSEPYKIKVTVPVKSKPPKVKLAKATLALDPENGLDAEFGFRGGEILYAEPKNQSAFEKVFAGHGFDADSISLSLDYDAIYNSKGKVKAAAIGKTYSAPMNIWLSDARAPLAIKANIRIVRPGAMPQFSLSTSSVTLNKRYDGQRADIRINSSHINAGYFIREVIGGDAFEIGEFDDMMTIKLKPQTRAGAYPCKVVVSYQNKIKVLPFKVNVTNKAASVGLTARKGKIDLHDRENTSLTFKPKLNNYRGSILDAWIDEENNESIAGLFTASLREDGRVSITANSWLAYEEEFIFGKTYRLKLRFSLEGNDADVFGEPFHIEAGSAAVSIKPVRSKVKHGLSNPPIMYISREAHKAVIDLSPTSPKGAQIDVDRFNNDNSENKAFFLYLTHDHKLHIRMKDGASLAPGKHRLALPTVYEGQGLDKIRQDLVYKPKNIIINMPIQR